MIFVFGSNEAGIHGAGAAKTAREKFGAVLGVGFGPTGKSFAIPTRGWDIDSLDRKVILHYVDRFLAYARDNPHLEFQVTRIGCGLAGFTDDEIAPMFNVAPANCLFDESWWPYLDSTKRFWGTF